MHVKCLATIIDFNTIKWRMCHVGITIATCFHLPAILFLSEESVARGACAGGQGGGSLIPNLNQQY